MLFSGNHLVDVTYDNMALPGSPFTSKAYDVNAIVIQPIAGGSVGNHVEFTGKWASLKDYWIWRISYFVMCLTLIIH